MKKLMIISLSVIILALGVWYGLSYLRKSQPRPEPNEEPEAFPNIVFIGIAALRPDHLWVYGYPRPTSPNLDALAQKGVIFENAFTTF